MKLCFPETALTQHVAILGKTGAGKSSALRHIAENRLAQQKRVCVVDPKGDWWGLKSSADGRSAGFAVIAFGDFKEAKASDIPINSHSGKHVAELVATGNRPCIIGFRGWMPAAMTQFWIDFASTLFNANAGELFLFIDEVHNFAPKGRVMDPAAGKSLHWCNRIMSEGRGIGLVCAIASQRPQKVHNDTLTCCETLVAMRVIHAADRQALKDWIDGCGDETGSELLKNVASLDRGEGYVWSPEIGFGPQRVKFPMFTTFDSFAPPQLQRKVSDSGWADVDLGAVREKLATVIEEAKANDPTHLKAELGKLRAELGKLKAESPKAAPAAPATIERPVLVATELHHLKLAIEGFRDAAKTIEKLAPVVLRIDGELARYTDVIGKNHNHHAIPLPSVSGARPAVPTPARAPAVAPLPSAPAGGPIEIGSGGKRRMLIALAQNGGPMTHRRLSILTDISQSGGTWRTYLGELRGAGYVEGGDPLSITAAGLQALGAYDPLPTGNALREYWRRRLGDSGKRQIFDAVCAAYPGTASYEFVSGQTGISLTGGTWRTYLGELRGLELIEGGRGELRASDDLFQ